MVGANPIGQLDLELQLGPRYRAHSLTTSELFAHFDTSLLSQLKEDRRFDRKSVRINPKDLAPSFSMFANNPPDGGIIVIGVEDDGSITGCSDLDQKRLNAFDESTATYCPDARVEWKRVRVANVDGNDDFLIVAHVKYREDRLVETAKGDAYVRLGGTKRKLNDEERAELRNLKGQTPIEREAVDLNFPEDFRSDILEQFCESVRKHRDLARTTNMAEILEVRRLGKFENGKFVPNLACALVFAKDPLIAVPGAKIRFLRFDGTEEGVGDRFNATKDLIVEGPIPEIIATIEKVLDQQLRDFTRLGKDGKFYTAPEYPKEAWYELVVNACVHRSYVLRNMNIFIKMFDDRLVVESPGGFPPMVTPKNIYDMHQPRNPFLMDALFDLDYVKCAHEGTRRIRDTMMAMNLPAPVFQQMEVASAIVQGTLRNNIELRKVYVDADVFEVVGEAMAKTLSEHERRIVNFAAENDSLNVSQVQRLTGQTWPAARKTLGKLVRLGILEHHHRQDRERDPQARFVLKR